MCLCATKRETWNHTMCYLAPAILYELACKNRMTASSGTSGDWLWLQLFAMQTQLFSLLPRDSILPLKMSIPVKWWRKNTIEQKMRCESPVIAYGLWVFNTFTWLDAFEHRLELMWISCSSIFDEIFISASVQKLHSTSVLGANEKKPGIG